MDLDNLAESQFLKALDALYERGGADKYEGLKFDPRGCREYQAVLDLARAALTRPEGYVLVPSDLSTLQRYDLGTVHFYGDEKEDIVECARGSYVQLSDVQALLAARPEVP